MTRRNDGLTCTAKAKSTGERCGNPPIRGGRVCPIHGGKAPQTVATASREVFERLMGPGLVRYSGLINDPTTPKHVLASVLKDLFDRNGYAAPQQIEVITDDMVEREIARRLAEGGDE